MNMYRGMGIKKDAQYYFSLKTDNFDEAINELILKFNAKNKNVMGETIIAPTTTAWKNDTAQLTATQNKGKIAVKLRGSNIQNHNSCLFRYCFNF